MQSPVSNNVTGILVPVKNEALLANAIIECITNINLRQTLAQNAYTFAVNNYSNQVMLNAYNRVFNTSA